MAVMLSGWEGNRGSGGKITAYCRVHDCDTCGL